MPCHGKRSSALAIILSPSGHLTDCAFLGDLLELYHFGDIYPRKLNNYRRSRCSCSHHGGVRAVAIRVAKYVKLRSNTHTLW